MNATGNSDHAPRRWPLWQRAFRGAMQRPLDFEEIEDLAADAGHVVRMIERDGSIVPEFGAFDLV